jgi:hypothetical protein
MINASKFMNLDSYILHNNYQANTFRKSYERKMILIIPPFKIFFNSLNIIKKRKSKS